MTDNPNTNCLEGMKCPNPDCDSPYGPFEIECKTSVTVHDDGTDGDTKDTEWDDDSWIQCKSCQTVGTVADFREKADDDSPEDRISRAVQLIRDNGGYDGGHHKQWVLDQVLRTLLSAKDYAEWLNKYRSGEDGSHTYHWDEGIAP